MEKFELFTEIKEKNGRTYKAYYIIVKGVRVYFRPYDYNVLNALNNCEC